MDLAWDSQNHQLWIAGGNSGCLLALDPKSETLRSVLQLPTPLRRIKAISATGEILALEPARGLLHFVTSNDDAGSPSSESLLVGEHVVDFSLSNDGLKLGTLHQWSHQATLWERSSTSSKRFKPINTVSLPFAPLCQALNEGANQWLVGSAFGGSIAAVDWATGKLLGHAERDIHNIRSMALSPCGENLWVTHQLLHPEGTTLRGDIQWGFLMENHVSGIPIKNLIDQWSSAKLMLPPSPLEGPGNAAGDPEAILWTDRGECLVTLAGVGELALFRLNQTGMLRMGVGKRPVALAYDPEARMAFVANRDSGTISRISFEPEPRVSKVFRLNSQRDPSILAQGEALFHNAHLSFHGWFSCHSCHTDGHANGRLTDNEADGSFGAPKKVPPLGHVASTGPWSWLGKRNDLLDEIHRSIETTMREVSSPQTEEALLAYLETLKAPPPKRSNPLPTEHEAGRQVFESLGCVDCHSPPYYTDGGLYDAGITDEQGNKRFNPPSLLGVSQRIGLLHDGRAKSLRSLLVDHQHMITEPLDNQKLEALLLFLESI